MKCSVINRTIGEHDANYEIVWGKRGKGNLNNHSIPVCFKHLEPVIRIMTDKYRPQGQIQNFKIRRL